MSNPVNNNQGLNLYTLMYMRNTPSFKIPENKTKSTPQSKYDPKLMEKIIGWNNSFKTTNILGQDLYLSSFKLSKLKDGNKGSFLANSSDAAISARLRNDSYATSFNVNVSQLASNQKVHGNYYNDVYSALNLSGDFTINGTTISVTSSDSLNSIVNKINASGVNVSATITSGKLYLTDINTGAVNAFTATDNGSGGISFQSTNESVATTGSIINTGNWSHDLTVTQLADNQEVFGNSYADPTVALDLNGSFTLDGQTISVAKTDSLTNIMDKINAAGTSVSASINSGKLYLTNTNTGAVNSFSAVDNTSDSNSVTSSDSSVATINTLLNNTDWSHTLEVSQLADGLQVSGDSVSDVNAALNLSGQFVISGTTFSVAATDSLTSIKDMINTANIGVTASIASGKLVIDSNQTGTAATFTIQDITQLVNQTESSDASIATVASLAQSVDFSKTIEVTELGHAAQAGALDFDGASTWVDLGDLGNLVGGTNSMTFTARVWFDKTTGQAIFGQHTASGNNVFTYGAYGDTNQINVDTSSGAYTYTSGDTISDEHGVWMDLAVTVSGTTATYYKNGVAIGTDTIAARDLYATGQHFKLGADVDPDLSINDFFSGKMDNVKIYNRALSASEVVNGSSRGVVAEYNFNEGSGNILHDISGNGHDGTINGTVMWQQQEAATSTKYKVDGVAYTTSSDTVTINDASGNALATVNLQDKVGTTVISNRVIEKTAASSSNTSVASITDVKQEGTQFSKTVEITQVGQDAASGSLNFNGTNTYIKLDSLGDVGKDMGSMTIKTRIYRDVAKSESFLSRNSSTGGNVEQFGVWNDAYTINNGWYSQENTSPKVGEWIDVTYVMDGNRGRVYENGKMVMESEISSRDRFASNDLAFVIGQEYDTSNGAPVVSDFFKGKMDNMTIYNRALSDSEIVNGSSTGVVADYNFDEGSGTTLVDRSGNGHNGTIMGTVSWNAAKSATDTIYTVDGVSYTTSGSKITLNDDSGNALIDIQANSVGTTVIENKKVNSVMESIGVVDSSNNFVHVDQNAQDANFTVDGVAKTSSTNSNINIAGDATVDLTGTGSSTIQNVLSNGVLRDIGILNSSNTDFVNYASRAQDAQFTVDGVSQTSSVNDNVSLAGDATVNLVGLGSSTISNSVSGGVLKSIGILNSSGTDFQNYDSYARDAIYSVDGGANQTSSSNQVTVNDLDLTFNNTTSSDVSISAVLSAGTTGSTYENITEFVDHYNAMVSNFANSNDFIKSSFVEAFDSLYSNRDLSLSKLGINRMGNGNLKVDEDKIKQALEDPNTDVIGILSGENGFVSKVEDMASQIIGNTIEYFNPLEFPSRIVAMSFCEPRSCIGRLSS